MVKKVISKTSKIIFIILVVLLLYMPIFMIALQSFNNSKNSEEFSYFTFHWYQELFHPTTLEAKQLVNAIGNTFAITVSATILSTILGTLFAIGIHFLNKKWRQRMIFLNNIPIVNADIITGICLMVVFKIIFQEMSFSTILLAHLFFCIPYVVLSVLPKLSQLDLNLYDAAVDLGCSPIKALMKVIIPSIKTGILAGMLLAFTMSIDDFTISYFTGASLGSLNNVSMIVYLRKGKSLSPAVYAYDTILVFGTFFVLVGYNLLTCFKHKKNKLKELS